MLVASSILIRQLPLPGYRAETTVASSSDSLHSSLHGNVLHFIFMTKYNLRQCMYNWKYVLRWEQRQSLHTIQFIQDWKCLYHHLINIESFKFLACWVAGYRSNVLGAELVSRSCMLSFAILFCFKWLSIKFWNLKSSRWQSFEFFIIAQKPSLLLSRFSWTVLKRFAKKRSFGVICNSLLWKLSRGRLWTEYLDFMLLR